jgi:copper chaperone CopZ
MQTMTKPHGEKASAILRINPVDGSKDGGYHKIEESMKNLPGVSKARINYVSNTIEVNYDPEKVTLEKIREELRNLGSRPV